LICNFNLHYECLDECDDYHANFKKKATSNHANFYDDNEDEDENEGNDFMIHLDDTENHKTYEELGPNILQKLTQMNEAE
jgi:hypothetical protein